MHRSQLQIDRFSPIAADGGRIRAGIEFDGASRPVAYHFLPARPGDPYAPLDGAGWQTVRVGAEDVLHIFRPQEIGQVRGLPWTAPIALLGHELTQFQDAALVKSKVAALFTGFITDPDGQAGGLLGPGANGTVTASLEPGAVVALPLGPTVTFSDPPQTTDYPEFVKSHQRAIAAGMGATYEQVSGDYAGVTFSSVRAAMMEFRRKVEPIQYEFAHQFYAPIWRRFCTLAVLSGAVDAPDFFDDPEAFMACEWLPPRWEYINPAQDVAADIDAIAAYRLETFARKLSVSRQALVNDDLGAFADLSRRFGQAAAETEAAELVALLTKNSGAGPRLSDGQPLFHVSRGNLAAPGGVISDGTLSTARTAMRTQRGLQGQTISAPPKFLVVPVALETQGERWLATITPVNADGLEIAYLTGGNGPLVEPVKSADTDGVTLKVLHDFGVGFVESRSWFANPGA